MLKKIIFVFTIVCFSLVTSTVRLNGNVKLLKNYCIDYSLEDDDFYDIPGLQTDYVPQGICLLKNKNYTYRLITAYDCTNRENSCLYVITNHGEHIKTLFFNNSVGVHVGGVTSDASGSYVYVCDSKNNIIRIYDSNSIHISTNDQLLEEVISYPIENVPSFISYDFFNDSILVGSFSLQNNSKLVEYSLNFEKLNEISIPKQIQGITRLSTGEFVLSQSYGSNNDSYLLIGNIDNKEFKCTSKIKLPPCLEEIYSTDNDNIFLLFESAAKRFKSKNPIDKVILLLI